VRDTRKAEKDNEIWEKSPTNEVIV